MIATRGTITAGAIILPSGVLVEPLEAAIVAPDVAEDVEVDAADPDVEDVEEERVEDDLDDEELDVADVKGYVPVEIAARICAGESALQLSLDGLSQFKPASVKQHFQSPLVALYTLSCVSRPLQC